MSYLGLPFFKPSPAKLKTVPASSAKLENIPASPGNSQRESSEGKGVLTEVDEILIATLAMGQTLESCKIRRAMSRDDALVDLLIARAQKGIDGVLGTVGTTWNDVQAKCKTFDHGDSPDPALPLAYLKVVVEDFQRVPGNVLDIKTMDRKFTPIAKLVFLADFWVDPVGSKGADGKKIPTFTHRRNSTDTMSTMSIPPPPYGLVDWAETQRLRDLMG